MSRLAIIVTLVAAAGSSHAKPARVTARTPTTVYIDAGSADGLAPGLTWSTPVGGRAVTVRVVAVAAHDAVLEVDSAPPAIGTAIELPPSVVPPKPVVLRSPPMTLPPWQQPPAVLDQVQVAASRQQPRRPGDDDTTHVSGELALSAFVAADVGNTSSNWHDLALSSQLAVEAGSWRYDHLLEAHFSGSPEIWRAPLQNAQARFDIYLLRLAYAPTQGRFAASFGRQPGAPLGELGSVDGGRARLVLDPQFDVTVFAGLRPASDLSLLRAPRAGADLAWHASTVGGTRARADLGIAVDQYRGGLDRLQTAAAALVGTRELSAHADATLDLATDASGDGGARMSRVSAFLRGKHRALTASISGGYDRPFLARSLARELPELVFAPRTYAGVDARYTLRSNLDIATSARASRGDGFVSTYVDAAAMWWSGTRDLHVTTAPFAVIGTLVNELGIRGDIDLPPIYGANLGMGGVVERLTANGASSWAGLARIHGGRSFLERWRTSLSLEAAAGDGPVRLFMFALLGYRLGD
jgi:hypothetical protein